MGYPTILSQVFRKKAPARVACGQASPVHSPSRLHARCSPMEDSFERLTVSARRISPTARPAPGAAIAVKQLHRALSTALSERGDDAWRFGNHLRVLALLDTYARRAFEPSRDPAYARLRARFETLLQQARADVAAASAALAPLAPQRRDSLPPSLAMALGHVAVPWPLADAHALTQDYTRLCAHMGAMEVRGLSAALQSVRAGQSRMLVMPDAGKLHAAFGAGGAVATQRRIKDAAQAALARLQATLDAAAVAAGLS